MEGFDALRVGIYGGTFAPIHNGHVASAKAFMEQMKLDYLFVVPALFLIVFLLLETSFE